MAGEALVTVYEAESSMEAEVIQSILKANGVETTIRNKGMAGVFSSSTPGSAVAEIVEILVRSADSAKAEQVIMDYSSPED